MKTLLTAEFTHEEKSLKHFDAALKEFFGAVRTLGFTQVECCVEDDDLAGEFTDPSSLLAPVGPKLDPWVGPVPLTEPAPTPLPFRDAEPSTAKAIEFRGSDANPKPLNLKQIRARIAEEKATVGGNRILSQEELAERIGVSRDRIRQALK